MCLRDNVGSPNHNFYTQRIAILHWIQIPTSEIPTLEHSRAKYSLSSKIPPYNSLEHFCQIYPGPPRTLPLEILPLSAKNKSCSKTPHTFPAHFSLRESAGCFHWTVHQTPAEHYSPWDACSSSYHSSFLVTVSTLCF